MESHYSLQINFEQSAETFREVSRILGVPVRSDDNNPTAWIYSKVQKTEDPYFDFINKFLDILENKYDLLADLGIKRDDISVWFIYAYEHQCNMEFEPVDMKRLGENGIKLCISCYDVGNSDDV